MINKQDVLSATSGLEQSGNIEERLLYFEQKCELLKKQVLWVASIRGLLFLGAMASLYFCYPNIGMMLGCFFVLITAFIFFIVKSSRLKNKLQSVNNLLQINKNEQRYQQFDFEDFEDGKSFLDTNHAFAYDLDILGKGSIYQYTNRAATNIGKREVANMLLFPLSKKEEIEARQQAIQELSEQIDTCQNLQAAAMQVVGGKQKGWLSSDGQQNVKDWLREPFLFYKKKAWKPFLFAVPACSLTLLGLFAAEVISSVVLLIYALAQFLFVGVFLKRINIVHQQVSANASGMQSFANLLQLIEQEQPQAKKLQEIQSVLIYADNSASMQIKRLSKILEAFDSRLNLLWGFLANLFFWWDIQCVYHLEKWRALSAEGLPSWLKAMGQYEALCSMGTFARNHPNFVYAQIEEGDFLCEMKEVGHFLIPEQERVCNSFEMLRPGQIAIVTGANMAGKSTFLRTVGVNMVLAMAGLPVCAQKMRLAPTTLFTSVRTTDSLQKHESYFYAELKRLKQIVDKLENGEQLFVIIDEMLRGTNSKDKHSGSRAFIQKLLRYQTNGLFATHDVELGELINEYPEQIQNCRFEVEMDAEQLKFDYKMREGVCQSLNATFLMRQMKLTDEEVL